MVELSAQNLDTSEGWIFGDPDPLSSVFKNHDGGLEHAAELVRLIPISEANLLEANAELQLLNELKITRNIIADASLKRSLKTIY